MIEFLNENRSLEHIPVAKIKVIGVGGAGGNTVNWMVDAGYQDVEFIAINTDAQALQLSKAHHIIHIGHKSAKGLGAGANPEIGKRAAEEDLDKVMAVVQDADIVFLTGGLGGGTGSGGIPVIAQALREQGILTIVVVTKPFSFEGRRRAGIADYALERIKECADTLLIIPNQNLLQLVNEKVSMIEAFQMINEVLNQCVRGIADIITRPGHINVDFADVREIMKNQGLAVMGTGRASGADRAHEAALKAISSPLLENMSIEGARGVLLNITGNSSLSLHEISAAASVIYEQADPDANIILGSVIDDSLNEEVFVTVIATGFTPQPQIQETKNVASISNEQKKRDTVSSYSFNYAPHKSPHTISEPKNVINAPSKAPSAPTFVREVQQTPVRVAPAAPREVQQPRIEPIAQPQQPLRQEFRHEQTRQEVVRQEPLRQEVKEAREYVNSARYEAEPQEQTYYTQPLQQQSRPVVEQQAQESHVAQSSFAAHAPEVAAPVQAAPIVEKIEQPQQQAQTASNDIEVPAYLRKDGNNQQFNWNKFNKKKKHKFQ